MIVTTVEAGEKECRIIWTGYGIVCSGDKCMHWCWCDERLQGSLDKGFCGFARPIEIDRGMLANLSKPAQPVEPAKLEENLPDVFDGMSTRARNCLERKGILTIADLVKCTERELFLIRHLGKRYLAEIKALLHERGLSLMGEKE